MPFMAEISYKTTSLSDRFLISQLSNRPMKSGIMRDRTIRRGMDKEKLVLIWRALEGATEEGGWIHVAEIARRAGLNECTVRWYLDHYLNQAIDEQNVLPPGVRLRLVRLKRGIELVSYMSARKAIEEVKKK